MNKPTILFFDSGVGGFSVYKEVRALLPDCHYLYCFDNAYFPYSEKTEETIIERVVNICQTINQSYPLDLIVIACNTASTVVLPALRETFDIPIVGTVPAIKPAAEQSETKRIGLLATKGTVKRQYVNDLIHQYASDCQIERIGSTKLVEIAEEKLRGNSVDLLALRNELSPWLELADLDSIILGCTHFPLIAEEIKICLPQIKYFHDPGAAIARRVKYLLQNFKSENKSAVSKKRNLIFATKPLDLETKFQQALQFWGFEELQLLEINK